MKILLAEDEMISREMLSSLLKRWGYEVIPCQDGSYAWEILQSKDAPRIALLDWMMPGMDGVELTRRIREENKRCYIIIITGNYSHDELEQVIAAGADDYVHKGSLPQEILMRLRAAETIALLQEELVEAKKDKKSAWKFFSFRGGDDKK